MKIIDLGAKNSVINTYMAQLRDVSYQQNRTLFRRNLTRIARAMAYEVSHTLEFQPADVQTPLGVKKTALPQDRLVVATVLRAGLAFHEGFLDTLDGCDAAFVAAYRKEGTREHIEIKLDYLASPDLTDATLLLVDPMLATGGSIEASYHALLRRGTPRRIIVCSVVAAPEGIAHLQEVFPSDEASLYVAAIDERLNEAAYIVPGLGDCGDLCFGEKLSD